ncbi:MAG: hypothetical protein ACJ8OJ_16905 [Povalibacter sp.]
MPRQRNPIAIAAGKLILAIEKEALECKTGVAQLVLNRARTLLQASQSSSVRNLLDGRSVTEYLDADWVESHSSVKSSIDALMVEIERE